MEPTTNKQRLPQNNPNESPFNHITTLEVPIQPSGYNQWNLWGLIVITTSVAVALYLTLLSNNPARWFFHTEALFFTIIPTCFYTAYRAYRQQKHSPKNLSLDTTGRIQITEKSGLFTDWQISKTAGEGNVLITE